MYKMMGFNVAEQVAFLKRTFGEVLLAEGEYSEAEYNGRLSALMEMLRSRGTTVSENARRMFSGNTTDKGSFRTQSGEGYWCGPWAAYSPEAGGGTSCKKIKGRDGSDADGLGIQI